MLLLQLPVHRPGATHDAEVAALHAAELHELRDDEGQGVGRHGKGQSSQKVGVSGVFRSTKLDPDSPELVFFFSSWSLELSSKPLKKGTKRHQRTKGYPVIDPAMWSSPWVPEMMAVLTPTARPWESTKGPPELPGLMAVSVLTSWAGRTASPWKGGGWSTYDIRHV